MARPLDELREVLHKLNARLERVEEAVERLSRDRK
jgi:hypothetical protein